MKRHYVIRIGDVIKIGQSTRQFIVGMREGVSGEGEGEGEGREREGEGEGEKEGGRG